MALKLPDSAVPMGDFPVAKAVDIDFDDGENLQDKFDNGELGGGGTVENVRKVFCDINELNNAKGTNMSLVVGEDNTEKIINVLEPYEEFINWFGNTTSTDRFGIDQSMGIRLNVISIQRCTGNEGFAYAITNEGKLLSRFLQDGVLSEWNYDSTNLTEMNTKISQLETQVSDLFQSVPNDITDLENRITTNETNITDLQEQIDNLDITDLENRITTNETNITDLQEQIDNLDIPDITDLTNVRKVFCDINELNNAKGTNMSLVVGEDNTEKIINVLEPYEEFINWFGNTTSTDRFGIDESMGIRLNVISIQRCTGNEGFAYAITNEGKLLSRFLQDGVLSEWNYDSSNLPDLENRITTNETNITDLENRVTTNEADITDLQEQIDNLDIPDITDLKNRVTTNEADITDLQEQIDNLDIPDITDINDKLSKLEDKRVYNSLEELNTAKGLSISFTSGEDNTMKIVDALSPFETFADYFGNSIKDNRFGIDTNTYGSAISLLSITKFDDNIAIIRAYMSNGKLLVRRYQNGVLVGWQYDKTDLSEMNTKISQLETQVSDLFQSVSDGKTLVANAITDKGVSTATNTTFATMASNISKINTNGYKEETASWNKTSTGTNRIVFTFSADVYGVKQITPPSDASSNIVPETSTSMFTINGRKLTLYVNGVGTWEVTAIVRNV